jgi:hypothetical protein
VESNAIDLVQTQRIRALPAASACCGLIAAAGRTAPKSKFLV